MVLIAACAHSTWAAATFSSVKAEYQSSDTLILDRNGELLHRLRTDATVRRGQWVALADISPALRTALVLSEDKRFYEHSGVDWRAVSSAAWANLWNSKTRGASTITMQLAGLLDEDLKRGSNGRSVVQKLGQTVSAQMLESRWRKDQILEAYLNLVPFRGELVGIDAMSQTLFGKAAHGLDHREAAIAAALVRAPNAKPAQVAQRACAVLQSLQAPARADCEALDLFTTAALQRRDYAASVGIAPHVARQLTTVRADANNSVLADAKNPVRPEPVEGPAKASTSSVRTEKTRTGVVRTTLRAPLQRFAVQTLQQHLRELQGRHVEDGALVVLDNSTGEVLAWVGSSGALSNAADVDGVTALRQPGSTLKPFLYGQAMAERRITAASLLDDSGTQIQTSGGLYIPQNYDRHFKGWVSTRTALAASLNVPAVRTLVMVSPDAFHKQLVRLGLPLRESGDYYGYSLALGSAEVSLLNLTNAYRALANGGRASPTTTLLTLRPQSPSVRDGSSPVRAEPVEAPRRTSVQALDPRAAFIVGAILSDPLARARTFGTDSVLATRFWSAVKTGTSKDMRDNWAVGWSQRYTVGVWVGNASGAPMWDVSGTTGAAPIWAAVMNHLHAQQPSRAPKAPAGVVQATVRFANAGGVTEAARSEWFISGTQQAVFAIDSGAGRAQSTGARGPKGTQSNPGNARITAPTSGTIIALDPDIPPNRQRVLFEATGDKLVWQMDGKTFAKGPTAQWLPWPGRHVVRITNVRGDVLDEIRLEVRGAGVKGSERASSKN
ncbi:transglycosylase domain-containing protein [Rhodoferax saidenbachensis]|uniref:peptidoglycan glycosyltransferase n=1 Tax=Rhodoferax saidenbachensis TaxID=1484693 RepID=A0A1P8KCE4_9BURK|nr:transglycosylase domain-containing protein [Rhodoferax saidenbachensis]APW43681.1 penicillin-binding protein 1C [Rhodoferax saidenbachensis]